MVNFGSITQQHDRVLIVAAGPSMTGVHIPRMHGVAVIAVKQAIYGLDTLADYWVTVDPNIRAQAMMDDQVPGVQYIAVVPDDYGLSTARIDTHRRVPHDNVLYLRRLLGSGPLKSRTGLSEDSTAINTGNSAWGALGVAYLMRPRKIGLLGLDASQAEYGIGKDAPNGIGKGGPRGSLKHLPALFATALPQLRAAGIEVTNGSLGSKILCFPKCTPQLLLSWITQ